MIRQRAIRLMIAAAAAGAALSSPGLARAHAHYDHSTPAIGEVVTAAPARLDLYTDSDMAKVAGKNAVTVMNAAGEEVDDGPAVLDDANRRHLSIGLKANLPPGRYLVAFTTLSDVDGGADGGRFAFNVGRGPSAAETALDAALSGASAAHRSSSSGRAAVFLAIGAGIIVALALAGIVYAIVRRRWAA